MGATFSRLKTWAAEILTYSDLNAEFDNILTNLTPAGIDDESTNAAAMQTTADPYPAASPSLATSLQGELQRIRYLIAQITGKTYWYIDPDASIATLAAASFAAGTKAWFYQNTAPTGWTLDATPADALLAVKGGSNAYNANGGTQQGTWTQPGHTHDVGTYAIPAISLKTNSKTTHSAGVKCVIDGDGDIYAPYQGGDIAAHDVPTTSINNSAAAITGASANGATAATWRPLAQVGIICTKD